MRTGLEVISLSILFRTATLSYSPANDLTRPFLPSLRRVKMFWSGLFMAREELDLLRLKFGRGAKPWTAPNTMKRRKLDRVFIVFFFIQSRTNRNTIDL